MQEKLVSIIVPCYNVERFLNDCFKSIKNQTYKNFEDIFVDDGSKDNTLNILKTLCENDKRFKYITKENGGVSNARNTGLANAQGEYVYFCDADDILKANFLQVLVENLKDVDVSVCSFKWINEKFHYKPQKTKKKTFKTIIYEGKDNIMSQLYSGKLGYGVWNKIFKTEKLKQMTTFPKVFNEKSSYGEDTEFVADYLSTINKLRFVKAKLYLYRQTSGGLVHSKFNEKKLGVFDGIKKAENFDENIFKEAKIYIKSRKCVLSLEMLFRISKSDYRNKDVIKNLYYNFKNNLKYVRKGKRNAWYLRLFLPAVLPYFKLKFNKYLKKTD